MMRKWISGVDDEDTGKEKKKKKEKSVVNTY